MRRTVQITTIGAVITSAWLLVGQGLGQTLEATPSRSGPTTKPLFSPPGSIAQNQGDGLPWRWQFPQDWRPTVFRRSPWNPLGFSPASPAEWAAPPAAPPIAVSPTAAGQPAGQSSREIGTNPQNPPGPKPARVRPRSFQWNPATGKAEPVELKDWGTRALPSANQGAEENVNASPQRTTSVIVTDQPRAEATKESGRK
jgi:hypothetical protein